MRLIDADAAADKIMRETGNRADDLNMIGIALMIGIAKMLRDENDFPTIEAEPVRHGRMIEGRHPDENKCSECGQNFRDDIGFILQDDDGQFRYPKRCPECGCYWECDAE